MKDALQISIASELGRMEEVLYLVLAKIKDKKPFIVDDDFMDLRLIFTELLSNAIIHGNRYNLQKKVHIFIEFTKEGIESKIMDEGNGFNFTDALKPIETIEDLLLETGRGIKLVSSIADEVVFLGKGNEVKFSKKVVVEIPERAKITFNDHVCIF